MRLFFIFATIQLFGKVSALYLTWQDDPTTTMTIHWHGPKHEGQSAIYLKTSEDTWEKFDSSYQGIRYLNIHTVSLNNLDPNTEYTFRIGKEPKTYFFKTAPAALHSPLRFIVGGDADQTTRLFSKMNETVAKQDPLFCVIGGDIAYAVDFHHLMNFSSLVFNRWMAFFSLWKEQMIAFDGRLIPLVVCPGNHDILDKNGELFFTLFPSKEKRAYRTLDFGEYLSLILLDTGYLDPIEGIQTTWLEKKLLQRTDISYLFAIYHQAAYPSFYPYDGKEQELIRKSWCPLFDSYQITAAFENHNHTYKKTHPIKDNQVDPDGIIYFGDGCWGAVPRKPKDHWYLAETARINNVYLIELVENKAKVNALNLEGKIIDSTGLSPRSKFPLEKRRVALQ